jgi:hypothetical protein
MLRYHVRNTGPFELRFRPLPTEDAIKGRPRYLLVFDHFSCDLISSWVGQLVQL